MNRVFKTSLTAAFFATIWPDTSLAPAHHSSAAIAFTGNEMRLAHGLKLYMNRSVDYLFITGNDETRDAEKLINDLNILHTRPLDNIIFDRLARDTADSARNANMWMKQNNITNVMLVTSAYHMNRTVELMRRNNGAALITPCAITDPVSNDIIVAENLKYLTVTLTPTFTHETSIDVRKTGTSLIHSISPWVPRWPVNFLVRTHIPGNC